MFTCCQASKSARPKLNEMVKERIGRLGPSIAGVDVPSERLRVFADVIARATDQDSRAEAFSTQWLMDMVQESLKTDTSGSDGRRYCMAMLFTLAAAEDNKERMLNTNWLLSGTLKVAEEEQIDSDIKLYTMGMFKELSSADSNQVPMYSDARIMNMVQGAIDQAKAKSEIRTFAFALLCNLACHETNQVNMFDNKTLMQTTARVLEEEPAGSETIANIMAMLWNISLHRENKVAMLNSTFYSPISERILRTEPQNSQARSFCLGLLQSLASIEVNRPLMYSQHKWLLASLERIIREEENGTECKQRAFGLLWSLALSPVNQPEMFKNRNLVVMTKDKALAKEPVESGVKANAYGMLWSMAQCEENKSGMFRMKRLMDLTETTIGEEPPGSEARANALGMLSELAALDENRLDIVRNHTLVDFVMKAIRSEPFSGSEAKLNGLEIFLTASLKKEVREEMMNYPPIVDMLEFLLESSEADLKALATAFAIVRNLAVDPPNKRALFARGSIMTSAKRALQMEVSRKAGFDERKAISDVEANVLGLLQNLCGTEEDQDEPALSLWKDLELMKLLESVITKQVQLLIGVTTSPVIDPRHAVEEETKQNSLPRLSGDSSHQSPPPITKDIPIKVKTDSRKRQLDDLVEGLHASTEEKKSNKDAKSSQSHAHSSTRSQHSSAVPSEHNTETSTGRTSGFSSMFGFGRYYWADPLRGSTLASHKGGSEAGPPNSPAKPVADASSKNNSGLPPPPMTLFSSTRSGDLDDLIDAQTLQDEAPIQEPNFESLQNAFGFLQNLAFRSSVKGEMMNTIWISRSWKELLQINRAKLSSASEEADMHLVRAACLGMLWNLSTQSTANAKTLLLDKLLLDQILQSITCVDIDEAACEETISALGLMKELASVIQAKLEALLFRPLIEATLKLVLDDKKQATIRKSARELLIYCSTSPSISDSIRSLTSEICANNDAIFGESLQSSPNALDKMPTVESSTAATEGSQSPRTNESPRAPAGPQ